jgi:N-acetylglucosaminyl-diphospho-decaprenol L-rhamnosyltransferase
MPPTLSIVIVTYNSAAVIANCLASIPLGSQTSSPQSVAETETQVETIVVDNGSTDGTPDLIRAKFPWVTLLADHGNLLFAGGNNYGFQHATAPFILMLNPDTIVHPGALHQLMVFALAHPQAGMVAPHIVNPNGTLQHNTFRFPDLTQAFYGFFERLVPINSIQNGRYPLEDYIKAREVEHILGAALLFRRELYQQLPGMDEKFGIYFEETDWCYRAHKAGWHLFYTPAATITHLGAHSTGQNPEKSSAQFYKSQAYFYRKNYGLFKYALLKLITFVGLSYWLARSLWGYLRGHLTNEKLRLRLWSYGEILKA